MENRGLKPAGGRVWAYLGDGETDEPESLGALKFASREKLDNLIWIVNCNLQRLDGPVHGNGQVIQELEGIFRGAGWNVIKLAWGSGWDALLEKDREGVLIERFNRLVDGDSQRYAAFGSSELREHFFDTPELKKLIEGWTDDDLDQLNRGGHDPVKVYTAYKAAMEHKGAPTVILARTVKGYGLGEAGEGRNITHQQKKLTVDEMKTFRDRFNIPISDEDIPNFPFYRPGPETPEYKYLVERREELGGFVPQRVVRSQPLETTAEEFLDVFLQGTCVRAVSTYMVNGIIISQLLLTPD